MLEHVRAIGIVALVRSLCLELPLGIYILLVAARWGESGFPAWWPSFSQGAKPLPGDRLAFLLFGAALLALALVRLAHAVSSLQVREIGRRLGLLLAGVDFLTPITLPLAFWSLVAYRHPETREFFRERRLRRRSAAIH
jgi:hypothetical protein